MKYIAALAIISSAPSFVYADQADFSNAETEDVIQSCITILRDSQGDVSALAEELLSRKDLSLHPDERFRGMRCLLAYYGKRYFFDPERGAFYSEEDEKKRLQKKAANQRVLDEFQQKIRQERTQNRVEYQKRLRKACYDKLSNDAFTALTADACVELFVSHGFEE